MFVFLGSSDMFVLFVFLVVGCNFCVLQCDILGFLFVLIMISYSLIKDVVEIIYKKLIIKVVDMDGDE